jgi:Tfp pilus assembly protein PilX
MRTNRSASQRGFAVILVVLIVALLSIVAVTLLDLVRVDLTIMGQNRQNFEAAAAADGALFEIWNDTRTNAPSDPSTAANDFVVANPNDLLNTGVPLGVPAASGAGCGVPNSPCLTSAFYRPAAADLAAQDYGADVCWLSIGYQENTGVNSGRQVLYQYRVVSEVNNGQSTAEERMEVVQTIGGNWDGTQIRRYHCR